MSKIIRLTESKLVKLIKDILNEDEKHIQSLYKNWALKKSGNPTLANSLMGDFFKYQKSLLKKDFNQYSSADELKSAIDDVKKRFKEKQLEKEVDKIYQDNSLLVVMAKTWEASCKYGAGTKWCTASNDDSSYWKRHNSNGTEFIWINNKIPADNPYHKLSLFITDDGTHDWCNSLNQCSKQNPYELAGLPQPKNYEGIFNKCSEINNARSEERKEKKQAIERKLLQNPIYIIFLEFLESSDFQFEIDDSSSEVIYDLDETWLSNQREYSVTDDDLDDDLDEKLEEIHSCTERVVKSSITQIKEQLTNYMRNELISDEYEFHDDMDIEDVIKMFHLDDQIREILSEMLEGCYY